MSRREKEKAITFLRCPLGRKEKHMIDGAGRSISYGKLRARQASHANFFQAFPHKVNDAPALQDATLTCTLIIKLFIITHSKSPADMARPGAAASAEGSPDGREAAVDHRQRRAQMRAWDRHRRRCRVARRRTSRRMSGGAATLAAGLPRRMRRPLLPSLSPRQAGRSRCPGRSGCRSSWRLCGLRLLRWWIQGGLRRLRLLRPEGNGDRRMIHTSLIGDGLKWEYELYCLYICSVTHYHTFAFQPTGSLLR